MYLECEDVVVLGPSGNNTKDSYHSSMRQQYMYIIYLYQGDTPVSFTSYLTPSLKYPCTPIPLVVISPSHPNCEYTWDCPQDKNMEFPLLPVIFVDQPLLFNALSVLMVMKSLLPF